MAGGSSGRLFVAVWPPSDLVEILSGIERPERPGLRWTTPDQWHITLAFLGSADREEVTDAVSSMMERGQPPLGPQEASAGPAPHRLGSSVWVLPVMGLEALAVSVGRATARLAGRHRDQQPFLGHLTLARARPPGVLEDLDRPSISLSWTVCDIALVASELAPGGARYQEVATWPLPGGAPWDGRKIDRPVTG